MNKINYKQVIALGFKRKEFGNDSVFFDENGYEYFVAKQTILKTQGVKIVAYWHPETKEIELLYLKKENVISRQKFSGQHGLARYRAILEFFKVKPVQTGTCNSREPMPVYIVAHEYFEFDLDDPIEKDAPVYGKMTDEEIKQRRTERATTPSEENALTCHTCKSAGKEQILQPNKHGQIWCLGTGHDQGILIAENHGKN